MASAKRVYTINGIAPHSYKNAETAGYMERHGEQAEYSRKLHRP